MKRYLALIAQATTHLGDTGTSVCQMRVSKSGKKKESSHPKWQKKNERYKYVALCEYV